jgi:hypothetical protein
METLRNIDDDDDDDDDEDDDDDDCTLLCFDDLITFTVIVPVLQDMTQCSLAKFTQPENNIQSPSPEKGMP